MDFEIEMVTISRDEYNELMDDALFLNCLHNAGVDNWKGYEFAQAEYNGVNDE